MRFFSSAKYLFVPVVIALALVCLSSGEKRGFILTSPKVLKSGTIEHLTLTLFQIPDGGLINIRLLKAESDDVISETKVYAQSSHSTWVELLIPLVPDTKARLHVRGIFNLADGYQINSVKEVYLTQNSLITFIQTDKPIYKPGQTVRFRVFPVNIFLEPIESKSTGDLWIENPTGIRVAQWKNVSFVNGLVQLELPLSGEPLLGDWMIRSEISGKPGQQIFKVDKYTLPRFEVTISPPPFILANVSTISWKICARYTYGKRVDGILTAHFTYEKYEWEKSNKHNRELPFIEIEEPISGCYDAVIQADDLLLPKREYSYRKLYVYAEVKENGTEIIENATSVADITHNPLNIVFLEAADGSSYFKPGLPYHGRVKITTPDKIPVSHEPVKICSRTRQKKICKNFLSDKHGHIHFTIPPQPSSIFEIVLEAKAINYRDEPYETWGMKIYQPHASMFLLPWYSPSDSFIQIQPSKTKFSCEKQEHVKIKYTTTEGSRIKFYHQIMSRGLIVQQGSHWRTFNLAEDKSQEMDNTYIIDEETRLTRRLNNQTRTPYVGEFLLNFDSRSFMSPVARLLIFYVRSDGEMVADSQHFELHKCLQNKVKLKFRQGQQYPGTEATLHLEASPLSFCGITFVDKSVNLINSDNKMTIENVFNHLNKFDLNKKSLPQHENNEHCERNKVQKETPVSVNIKAPSEDDLRRRKRSYFIPFKYSSIYADAITAFEDAGMIVLTDLILETRPCLPIDMFEIPSHERTTLSKLDRMPTNINSLPSAIPLEMVIDEALTTVPSPPLTPKSISIVRSYFPETWLWQLQPVGEIGEVIFSQKLPDTITEWTGNAVCISRKSGLGISDTASIITFQPFFVSIILPYSIVRGEKVPIITTIFNYLSYCLPIKLSLETTEQFKVIGGSNTHKTCVCGDTSKTHRFMIQPKVLGNITITVYGYSLDDDVICDNQPTARLRARDAATRNLLVEPEGFYREKTETIFFCPKDYPEEVFSKRIDLDLPNNLVEGSESAYFSVTGDLMGSSLKGLSKLVQLPVGCGEQNMVLFTPNIFVLDYLTATNRLTDEIKTKALDYMKIGYQRELNYRHSDGSYSAFGTNDLVGSMWLTAFVVRSFAQARRFIFIDEEDLNHSTQWIIQKQLENGCFPSIGSVLRQEMKGGVGENQQFLSTLTAYVLIALLESGIEKSSRAVTNALYCMDAEPNPSSYSLALFAYAAALAEHPSAEKYLNQLKEKANYNRNMIFWDQGQQSLNVEIGGYAILAYLQMGGNKNIAQASSVLRWIVQSRNSNGGFISTQDTVVALQALAKYGILTNQTNLDMTLIVEGNDFEYSFALNKINQLVVQKEKLPSLPNSLQVEATGDGCTLIQAELHYNIKNIPGSEAFHLSVTSTRVGSSSCNKPNIKVCTRYKIQDKSSNMAVIELKMVSGYVPDEWSLHALNKRTDLSLKRHEVNADTVVFYFSELTNEQKCFHFTVVQEFEVEDLMPAVAKLYDYYEQELSIDTNYTLESSCPTNLPEVEVLPTLFNDTELTTEGIQQLEVEFITNIKPVTTTTTSTTTIQPSEEREEEYNVKSEKIENKTPYEDFINVDHELDFPDRLEGNIPVTLDPPPSGLASGLCPLCPSKFPTNFGWLYCNSAFVLRVTVRDTSLGKMKILHNLSPYLARPQNMKAFSDFTLHPTCNCSSLNNNGYVLLVGSQDDSWNSEGEKHQIILDGTVLVMQVPEKIVQPQIVKDAREKCLPIKS